MKTPALPPPLQSLTIRKRIEKDGIGMGVLSDGSAYLTGSGLARMCGVSPSVIRDLARDWATEKLTGRGKVIAEILALHKYTSDLLYTEIDVQGAIYHAYPEVVCNAVLEYYAFVSTPPREQATVNARRLMRSSLRAFVYTQVGYDPRNEIADAWTQYHDRVALVDSRVPVGYFCIFSEAASLLVTMIREGVQVGEKTVPDVSIGQHWSHYWIANGLATQFGGRVRYEHNYPEYFAQALSNPQMPYAYPEDALPEFRKWMREAYIRVHYPDYIKRQVKGGLSPVVGQLAIAAASGNVDVAPASLPRPANPFQKIREAVAKKLPLA